MNWTFSILNQKQLFVLSKLLLHSYLKGANDSWTERIAAMSTKNQRKRTFGRYMFNSTTLYDKQKSNSREQFSRVSTLLIYLISGCLQYFYSGMCWLGNIYLWTKTRVSVCIGFWALVRKCHVCNISFCTSI